MRRLLLMTLAAAVALTAVPLPALAVRILDTPFDMIWRVQEEVGGDRGGRAQQRRYVEEAKLDREGDSYTGTISYADRIAVESPNGALFAQVAQMELELKGSKAEGSGAAGGTFRGDVRLTEPKVTSFGQVFKLSSPQIANAPLITYTVSGHWGLNGPNGELVFESVRPLGTVPKGAEVRDPSWFGRLSATTGELGGPQEFTPRLTGDAGPAENPPAGGGGGGGGGGGAGAGAAGGTASTPRKRGFFAYVRQGLLGPRVVTSMPVQSELAAAARALRDARPKDATRLPRNAKSIDIDYSGEYLDAKNRAAGQLLWSGPDTAKAAKAIRAWERARSQAALPLPPSTTGRAAYYAKAALDALQTSRAKGAEDMKFQVQLLESGPETPESLTALRTVALTAIAAQGNEGVSVLGPTNGVAKDVRTKALPESGPKADAVLAAAGDPLAPRSALVVIDFLRAGAIDVHGTTASSLLPGRVLERYGTGQPLPSLSWKRGGATQSVAPQVWFGYRRGDGREYWLAGPDGGVALTDSTLIGWAYTVRRGTLVEANDVAKPLALYSLGD